MDLLAASGRLLKIQCFSKNRLYCWLLCLLDLGSLSSSIGFDGALTDDVTVAARPLYANPCYYKDGRWDPCNDKDRCELLATARTEVGSLILQGWLRESLLMQGLWILLILATLRALSLILQGLLANPCYCKDYGSLLL
ncbi:hypothetical protein ACLKA6_019236 [Drosophila palustris]